MGILRLLLALSVVIAHSNSIFGFSFVGPQLAVQTFYIISGFYMTLILNEKYVNDNNSYKLFLTNRLLRLYPVYWTVLIFTLLFAAIIIIYTQGKSLSYFTIYENYLNQMNLSSVLFLIFTNIFLFFQDIVMFLGLDIHNGTLFFTENYQETSPQLYKFLFLPQAWTIGIEMMFYLIAPLIVRRKLKYIILLIIVSVSIRLLLLKVGFQNDPWSYRFFPSELVFFLLGTISYHIYKRINIMNINASYLYILWFFMILTTILFSLISINAKYFVYFILFFISIPFVFYLTKQNKFDRYLGELSYPIYISHILIISLLNKLFEIKNSVMIIGATIFFSIILYEIVVKRIELFRQKRLRNV